MKSRSLVKIILVLATVFGPVKTLAEDIDLFVGRSSQAGEAPNLLIVLDNTANFYNLFCIGFGQLTA